MLQKSPKEFSIASRLFYRFLIGITIVATIMMIISFKVIHHEVNELYDGELSQTAKVVLSFYAGDKETMDPTIQQVVNPFRGSNNYEKKLIFQLWDQQGNLLMRSSNAPLTPLTNRLDHFDSIELLDQKVRVYAFKSEEFNYTIQVGQRYDIRNELEFNLFKIFMYGLLVMLLLILVNMWWVTKRSLKPLVDITQQISQRSSDNLGPVDIKLIPLEIKGMVNALNQLFTKLSNAFNNERRFIADASHELRTPLAGLKAQAQIAIQDKSRVDQSLQRIVEGVDRTSRLANQLLSLSRADGISAQAREPINIQPILKNVLSDLSLLIKTHNATINNEISTDLRLIAGKDECYVLLKNIIENAVLYASPNAQIEITQTIDASHTVIEISDNGPGVDNEKLERIFDPFYRDEEAKAPGSGLGLAIVKRISQHLNVKLEAINRKDSNGLIIRLSFLSRVEA